MFQRMKIPSTRANRSMHRSLAGNFILIMRAKPGPYIGDSIGFNKKGPLGEVRTLKPVSFATRVSHRLDDFSLNECAHR